MSSGQRFKFNGSHLFVQKGFVADSPAQAITGITKANPAVITATGSDYPEGAVVKPLGIVGMTELNGKLIVVDDPAADHFEAFDFDTTTYGAYGSGGTLSQVDFAEFCELTGANQQGAAANQVDVSTICSTAKEFEQGLADTGTLQLDYNFAPNSPIQSYFQTANKSGDAIAVKIQFPGQGGTIIMFGTIQQTSFTGKVGDVWTAQCTMKLTGDYAVLPAA